MQTELANALEAVNKKVRYDGNVKKVLADKYILAWIMQYTTKEFRKYDIETIRKCIEAEPEISSVPVYPGLTNAVAITGLSTEDAVPHEGKVTYDIRFYARTPEKEKVKIIINVEMQNKYHIGYDLVTRGIFYAARQISAQLDKEFTVNEEDKIKYGNLKKVYSVWICMNCPKYAEDTITSYDIKPTQLYGNFTKEVKYDLMSIVMVCLGKNSGREGNAKLLQMLSVLLSTEIDFRKKKEKLEGFDIPMDTKFGEEVLEMCNLSDWVMEQGIEKGIEQGIEQGIEKGKALGIEALVKTLKEFKISNEEIVERLIREFSLSEVEAKKFI